jgi:hypothetical protein
LKFFNGKLHLRHQNSKIQFGFVYSQQLINGILRIGSKSKGSYIDLIKNIVPKKQGTDDKQPLSIQTVIIICARYELETIKLATVGRSRGAKPWGEAVGRSRGAKPWGEAVGRSRGAKPWHRIAEGGQNWLFFEYYGDSYF